MNNYTTKEEVQAIKDKNAISEANAAKQRAEYLTPFEQAALAELAKIRTLLEKQQPGYETKVVNPQEVKTKEDKSVQPEQVETK